MNKNTTKVLLFILWSALIVGAFYCYKKIGIPILEYPELIRGYLEPFGMWGPIIYIVLYTIRPLVFFPGTLLTTVSGLLFGPLWGIAYTLIGANLSANLAFCVGRYFGKGGGQKKTLKNSTLKKYKTAFRENGFLSVLIMRLIYLPFDLVSYVAGASNVRITDFALATFIGILPGTISFVFLGASLTDPKNLALAAAFFILGLVISKAVKKTKKGQKLSSK